MAGYLDDFDAFVEVAQRLSVPELAALYNTDRQSRVWMDDPSMLGILTRIWRVPTGQGHPDIKNFRSFLREYYINYPNPKALDYFPVEFYVRYLYQDYKLGEFVILLLESLLQDKVPPFYYDSVLEYIISQYPDIINLPYMERYYAMLSMYQN